MVVSHSSSFYCNGSLNMLLAAYSVNVGLQQTTYTVTEVDEQQLVCFEVLSGDVNGREFVIDYTTSSGTASKSFHS